MRKISWYSLEREFTERDETLPPLIGVIVFDPRMSGWKPGHYSLANRSYVIDSSVEFFKESNDSPLFGECLDCTKQRINISHYLTEWKISYCLIFFNKDEYEQWKSEDLIKPVI